DRPPFRLDAGRLNRSNSQHQRRNPRPRRGSGRPLPPDIRAEWPAPVLSQSGTACPDAPQHRGTSPSPEPPAPTHRLGPLWWPLLPPPLCVVNVEVESPAKRSTGTDRVRSLSPRVLRDPFLPATFQPHRLDAPPSKKRDRFICELAIGAATVHNDLLLLRQLRDSRLELFDRYRDGAGDVAV